MKFGFNNLLKHKENKDNLGYLKEDRIGEEKQQPSDKPGDVEDTYIGIKQEDKEFLENLEGMEQKENILHRIKTWVKKNKMLYRIVAIGLICIMCAILIPNILRIKKPNEVDVVNIDSNKKTKIGKQLLFMDTVMVKSIQEVGTLTDAINKYKDDEMSLETFKGYIEDSNSTFTFFYFATVGMDNESEIENTTKDMKYTLYLLRRASEELTKFEDDKSSLRISVAEDLISLSKAQSVTAIQEVTVDMATYNINPDKVSIDQLIWEKLDQYKSKKNTEQVVFNDIETENQQEYKDYIDGVNDGLFLVTWEIDNMYKYKMDYINKKLTKEQLDRKLQNSGNTIILIVEQFKYLNAPEQLTDANKSIVEAMDIYKDGVLAVQKFTMTGNISEFDIGKKFFNLANSKTTVSIATINALKTKFGL